MRPILYLMLSLLCSSCIENIYRQHGQVIFEDFESYNSTEDFLLGDQSTWTYFQQTRSANYLELDSLHPHSGKYCLKLFALPSENGASKMDIGHNRVAFFEGETFYFSAWFYVEGSQNLSYLFLFDLEENIPIGAGPGIRFALQGPKNYLKIERKKMLEADIDQPEGTEIPFPRNEWVQLEIEVLLSQKKAGSIKVLQNGQLIFDVQNERTLPIDKVTFLQGTKGIYDNVQVGITANSPYNEATIYLDDIEIKRLD